ncbi:hypothetical protein ACBQ24_12085 [Acinetobacter terrestris]|uniref:hypothetical protein n=1 Tax=Acinetobacter terrestris TaxID=2529843 RepID=UPI0035234395
MKSNLAQQSNNDNSDFLPGDVVVYMNHIKIDALKTVEAFQPAEYYWLEGGQLVHHTDIRSASVAELDAEMRLGKSGVEA